MLRGRTVGRHEILRVVTAIVLAALVTACATIRTVDVQAPGVFTEEVRPGDWVAVTTHDGRELLFEVMRVEPDALIGTREHLTRDEVGQLEVRRGDALRSLGLFAGGLLAVNAILALLILVLW